MTEIDDRPGFETCVNDDHEPGCPCRAGGEARVKAPAIVFKTMGSASLRERSFYDFPVETQAIVVFLADERSITIADLGSGPIVRVQGPDDEVLGDYVLPSVPQSDTRSSIEIYQADSR